MSRYEDVIDNIASQIKDGVVTPRRELAKQVLKAIPKQHWEYLLRPKRAEGEVGYSLMSPEGVLVEHFELYRKGVLKNPRFSNHQQRIRELQDIMLYGDHAEWHSGLRAIWQIGLKVDANYDVDKEQDKELHSLYFDFLPKRQAAYALLLVRKEPTKSTDEANRADRNFDQAKGHSFFIYEGHTPNTKGYAIPFLYYPVKAPQRLQMLKEKKAKFTNGVDLGEETDLKLPLSTAEIADFLKIFSYCLPKGVKNTPAIFPPTPPA